MAGDILIRLLGDARDLEKKFESVGGKLSKVGDKLTSVGKKMTLGVTVPLLAAGFGATQAASDLEESLNKVDVVFGKTAATVKRFSENAATAMGISRQEALASTGAFGNLFRAMGLGEQISASMSTSLVKLAGDLASFNNVDPTEALDALRSGLTGETEPLKRFGVNISEATLKAKALELGLISNAQAAKKDEAAAEALADAQRNLADAKRTVAERAEAAARAVRDADEGVIDAEERLQQAQRDAKTAQEALTDARKAARQALEDLELRVKGNAIEQQRATLRVKDAQKELSEARKSGDARRILDAELDLKDAELSLVETQRDAKRDQEELNERRKQGVEGSNEMKAAQDRVAQANDSAKQSHEDLADAEQRAADARRDQANSAADSARTIADAQRSLAKAQAIANGETEETTGVLSPAIKAQAAYALIMEQTEQAQGDFARTSEGAANKQRILTAQLKDQAAVIGGKLLPIKIKLLDFLGRLLDSFSKLSPEAQNVTLVIAGLAAATGPVTTAVGGILKSFKFLQGGLVTLAKIGVRTFNAIRIAAAFLFANPIILAIAAVIVAVVLIIKHWDKVKAFLLKTWAVLKDAGGKVFNFLRDLFLNFTPLGLIIKHWDTIIGFFKSIPGKLAKAGAGMWDWIKDAFKSAINWIIDAWNKLEFKIPGFDPPGPGPKFGGITIGVPDIPRLHTGGIFRAPIPGGEGLALLKDRETVIAPGGVRFGGGRGGTTLIFQKGAIQFNGITDPDKQAAAFIKAVNRKVARGGPVFIEGAVAKN